jgi:Phycobilisome protein
MTTHGDVGARAAALLMRDREALALEVTSALYAESPALVERHGERGREKCLQDMRYNIDHLIPAVDLGDGAMFARYVEWLDGLLRARNVATRDVVRCLELLRDRCAERFPAAESATIGTIVDAGLGAVTAS